jgi:hypothetical protein
MKIPAGAKLNLENGKWESPLDRSAPKNGMTTQIRLAKGLGKNQRGVIIPSPAVLQPNVSGVRVSAPGSHSPMLPSAVFLFFDLVDSPMNTLVSIDEVTDDFLERAGLIVRSQIYGSGRVDDRVTIPCP